MMENIMNKLTDLERIEELRKSRKPENTFCHDGFEKDEYDKVIFFYVGEYIYIVESNTIYKRV
jgi:hypothetical protein